MDARETLEYPKLYDYFVTQGKIYEVLPIITRQKNKTKVSLSLLDWFVTNYSKKKKIILTNNKKTFDVNSQYKAQLSDYKKEYFDPFNRGANKEDLSTSFKKLNISTKTNDKTLIINYNPSNKEELVTSFKQLNFLRWALKNKIIKYVEENADAIKKDYKDVKDRREKEKKKGVVKKRTINVSPNKQITLHNTKTIIKFNNR